MKRYIIAIDEDGKVYLRRTLCVTHHGESGEVQYDTKPVKPSLVSGRIRRIFEQARKLSTPATIDSNKARGNDDPSHKPQKR